MATFTHSPQYFLRQFGIKPFKKYLPDETIRESARGVKNLRDRKFSICSYFWFLVMAQCDDTIRGLDDLLKLKWLMIRKQLGLDGEPTPVTKQALSKRNVHTPVKIFENIFKHLVRSADRILKKPLYKDSHRRTILDASTLDLVARLISKFPGGTNKSRKTMKAQARLHINLNGLTGIPEVVSITGGRTNEKKKLHTLMKQRSESTIYLFDLGYWRYDFFNTLHQRGDYFVTRLKSNCKPQKIKRLGPHDWLVTLPRKARSSTTNIYRLVSVKAEGRTRYSYLTNLPDSERFSPEEIAALYKSRWEIETFFRDLKHVLGLTRFISYSANGIKIQIYVALITYILIKLVIHEAAQRHGVEPERFGFQRSVKVIRAWLQRNISSFYHDRTITQNYDDLLSKLMEYAYTQPPAEKEAHHAVA